MEMMRLGVAFLIIDVAATVIPLLVAPLDAE